jgi:signal transduction histidine kinase
MRTIVDQMTEGILLENKDRVVQAVNGQLGVMFGVPLNAAEMVGTDCEAGLQFVKTLTKDPEQFMVSIGERLKNGTPYYKEPIELASGRILERDFIPIYSEGQLESYLWTYRDVTESELAKHGLQQLVEKEKQLNDTRSKLVRTISHEFKKPLLNSLEGVNMLRTLLLSDGIGEAYGRNLDYLVNELERLNRNVNRLVTYESLYDPQLMNLRSVRARNLVSNYLNYNYHMFVVSEKFNIDDQCGDELLSLDMKLFDLALKNVVDNAIKYSAPHETIRISSMIANGVAHISVCNPIPAHMMPDEGRLGTPLYRANPDDDKGLGLGLGIVRNIVNLHSGNVEFRTAEGKFLVTIKLITSKE